MGRVLQSTVILIVSVGVCVMPTQASGRSDRPNFIFALADDWGWGDVGVYAKMANTGDKPPVTPNLDQLASEGTIFTRFHTLASVCSPSRASWLTGSWPLAVGSPYIFSCSHATNVANGQSDFVNLTTPFIARVLHDAGYATAHYGKWHLGCTPDAPAVNAYGFDDSATYVSNNKSVQLGNFSTDPWFPANSSALIVNHAIDFLDSNVVEANGVPTKNFYLNLWFHISHAPLNPSPDQLEKFGTAEYCPWSGMNPAHMASNQVYERCPIQIFRASQHNADAEIGRMVQYIRENPHLGNNTLILFSGDNGPEDPHIYFNSVGSAGVYRGRKRSLYEGGISTPLIAWWPGHVRAGVVSGMDFASIDWFPTVARMADVSLDVKTQAWLRGRDGSTLLLSGSDLPPRTELLKWDYRLNMPGHCYHQSPRLAIMSGDGTWKLLMNPDFTRVELYNTTYDLFEATNLAPEYPDVVSKLSAPLLAWVNDMPKSPKITYNAGCAMTGAEQITPFENPFGLSDFDLA